MIMVWGTWVHLVIWIVVSTILGLIFVGPGEAYLRQWTKNKTGYEYRVNHKGKKVFEDFNSTCLDEFAYTLLANAPIFMLDAPLWVKLILGVVTLVAFRILDGKQKQGLAEWADEKVHGALGCMLDDFFVGLQVAGIMSIPIILGQFCMLTPFAGGMLLLSYVIVILGVISFLLPVGKEDFKRFFRC